MLHRPHTLEAELVGQTDLLETVVVDLLLAPVGPRTGDGDLVEDAELHRLPLFAPQNCRHLHSGTDSPHERRRPTAAAGADHARDLCLRPARRELVPEQHRLSRGQRRRDRDRHVRDGEPQPAVPRRVAVDHAASGPHTCQHARAPGPHAWQLPADGCRHRRPREMPRRHSRHGRGQPSPRQHLSGRRLGTPRGRAPHADIHRPPHPLRGRRRGAAHPHRARPHRPRRGRLGPVAANSLRR